MTEAAPHIIGIHTTGGFRIGTYPGEIMVTKVASAESATGRMRFVRYLAYGALLSCGSFALLISARQFLPFVVILLAVAILRYLLVGIHNLRCTRDRLEVIDVFHGRKEKTRLFTRAEVKRVRFGAVSYSKYGAICGLIFTAAGKNIKTLSGLKCIEAQEILDELQRLGYDVVHDPAMPMMVEMEQSRRKSWLGS